MSQIDTALSTFLELDGAIAIAVVDSSNGMTVAHAQREPFEIELAGAANTEVVRSKLRAVSQLGLGMKVEDILITLTGQFHLIRLSERPELEGLFFYVVLDRARGNLALARRQLAKLDAVIDGL